MSAVSQDGFFLEYLSRLIYQSDIVICRADGKRIAVGRGEIVLSHTSQLARAGDLTMVSPGKEKSGTSWVWLLVCGLLIVGALVNLCIDRFSPSLSPLTEREKKEKDALDITAQFINYMELPAKKKIYYDIYRSLKMAEKEDYDIYRSLKMAEKEARAGADTRRFP